MKKEQYDKLLTLGKKIETILAIQEDEESKTKPKVKSKKITK